MTKDEITIGKTEEGEEVTLDIRKQIISTFLATLLCIFSLFLIRSLEGVKT